LNQFQNVISQIELFIRKYYKNRILKGLLLFIAVFIGTYILVATLEYIGRFSTSVRFFLLLSFVLVNSYLLIRFIVIPILNLNKLGSRLSSMDAADMIGKFFPEIGDKLRNTLQLNEDKERVSANLELVNASIEQRAKLLSPVSFARAIDLSENKQYLKYLLPLVLLGIGLGVFIPNLFTDGTKRVVNFNAVYAEPAPFKFTLVSNEEARQGENYILKIKLEGDEIPNEVKIYSNLGTYNLTKTSAVDFVHEFVNLDGSIDFYCYANGFSSDQFEVKMLKRPVLEEIKLHVNYPRHTGKASEVFENSGDVTVPEGSTIEWNLVANNLSKLDVRFRDTVIKLSGNKSNSYKFARRFLLDENYALELSSADIYKADSMSFLVNVIADKYPTISVEERIDSSNMFLRFIEGKIADDYGFNSLYATLNIVKTDTSFMEQRPIKFQPTNTAQLFGLSIDLSEFDLKAGERVDYSFTVRDNDAINGFKAVMSSRMRYEVPQMDELEDLIGEKDENLKAGLDKASKEAKEMQKNIKKLKQDMVNKPNLDWKDKHQLENLINTQEKFEKDVNKLQEEFEKNKLEKENLLDNSEELKAKQEQLQQLMEELMDEELMELFEELKELMEEMDKDALVENLEEMEQNAEDVEEELDRTLELFKNMELDQKLENLEEQLKDLTEKQEELLEETEQGKLPEEELAKKQEELNEKFEEVQKDIEEIKEKNEQLEKPRDLDFDEEMSEEIMQEMRESKENLDEKKSGKSEKNQSKAAEMMKQMADDVQAMKSQQMQQQQQEDMDAMRFLLENLVGLSYEQESLMNRFEEVGTEDPAYLPLNREQLAINKATVVVNDSLVALSKRVVELSSFINEELNELSYNLEKALELSEARKKRNLLEHQQYAMTSYNNLALMLSEVLDQMQQQMQNGPPGSGSCNKPGGTGSGGSPKPSAMSMEQMKQALADQIKKMKGGQKPGGEKGKGDDGLGFGEKPGGNKGLIPQLSAKERAKMAAEQGKIREGLKQLKQELNKDGSGAGNQLNDLIKDLEELQNDLINGNVGASFKKRQEDIYTRLLEHEKAMRERGFSDERESKEGKNQKDGNLVELEQYNRKKEAEIEFLRSLPVGLQVYYKTLINEYFNSVNTE
jgi:hypothetical protein